MNDQTSDADRLGIDPEDMGIAKEIMDFDPVYDVEGPTSVQGNIKLPTELSLKALSPDKQDAIREQLNAVPAHVREHKERELVQEALYQNSFVLRMKGGGGPKANPYQAATMEIANERETANQEALKIASRLAEVDHWKPVTDPATGKVSQVAVNAVDGPSRIALENELGRLQHKIEQLDGLEGQRRLKDALHASIKKQKSAAKQARIIRKAEKRADELDEQEQVERRAAALRSMRRDRLD